MRDPATARPTDNVLWLDCIAGLTVGVATLLLVNWLPDWYGLPFGVIFFVGLANLVYGSFSLFLVNRARRSLSLIRALACANMLWAPVAVSIAIVHADSATVFGLAHLLNEAVFVGILGVLEWRWQEKLADP